MTDLSPLGLPMTRHLPRVALLVDGDNVPFSDMASLEPKAQALGQVVIRRVYADMALRKDWAGRQDFDAFHCASGATKNHADIRLVIGALDLAHRGLAQAFMILSDDSDFTPLVNHLREMGLAAELHGKSKKKQPAAALQGKPKPVKLSSVDQALKAQLAGLTQGLSMQVLGAKMRAFPVKDSTGKANWRAYLKSKPECFSLTGSGQATCVTWCGGS